MALPGCCCRSRSADLLLAIPAGLLLFATDARAYAASPLFQAKMALIALADRQRRSGCGRATGAASGLRGDVAIAAGASILLWLGVIVLGRMVGYF